MSQISDKGYVFRPSYSDRVMDLDGGSYNAGTNLQLYDYNGTISQYFNIKVTKWYDLLQPADIGTDIFFTSNNNTTGGYINNEGGMLLPIQVQMIKNRYGISKGRMMAVI